MSSDSSIIAEARAITGYDTGIMSTSDVQSVLDIAKRELQSNKNNDSLGFYEDMRAERALFWLTCIFLKVKTGEVDGGSFSISELDVESIEGQESLYFDNFWRNYHSIGAGRPRGHLKGQRSDREYSFEN